MTKSIALTVVAFAAAGFLFFPGLAANATSVECHEYYETFELTLVEVSVNGEAQESLAQYDGLEFFLGTSTSAGLQMQIGGMDQVEVIVFNLRLDAPFSDLPESERPE